MDTKVTQPKYEIVIDSAFYNMVIEPKRYHEHHERDEHHDGTDTSDSLEQFLAEHVQTKEEKRRRQSKSTVKIFFLPMPFPTL